MLEKDIEKKVVEWCKKNCIFQQKLLGKKGMPDRIFYLPHGIVIFIEFKRPRKKPLKARVLQEKYHSDLRKLGYKVLLCNNTKEGIQFIKDNIRIK